MLNRILQLGFHPALTFPERNKLRVFNTACALALAIASFYLIYGAVSRFYLAATISVFFMSSILSSLFFISRRSYNTAFHLAMICSFLFLTGFTLMFGADAKAYFYFVFMPVASTILFDKISTTVKYMALSIALLMLNVGFVEFMQPYYHIQNMWYFGYPNMLFVVLLVFLGLRVFKDENLNYAGLIGRQKHALEEKNKEMTDSINYAKRIQYAQLAHRQFLSENLPEHFVLFKPKDIVSGDFYWASKKENLFYLAVCDSTGHGVPGAFMSLLNISFLNEALNEKNIREPHKVLDHVRARLIEHISKDGAKDGMDAILICYDAGKKSITYAAANNSPLLVRANECKQLPKDKMPVGLGERNQNFSLHTLEVAAGDALYLFTDGFADQFGGPLGKKFKTRRLENFLKEHQNGVIAEQEQVLLAEFDDWKGTLEQVDDICVIGLKF